MKKVFVNADGYLESRHFTEDCNISIDVSDEIYEQLRICKISYNWKYDFNSKTFSEVPLLDSKNLKELREVECFSIIDNRSQMWYTHLTNEQKQELEAWYQAWLDVTETKIIPEKPEWL